MSLNTLDVTLTARTDIKSYNVEINKSTLEILTLILEFKLASACHITRFISKKEYSRYIYKKLRRMWSAGFLESFKILSGNRPSLIYMLSRRGLRLLIEHNLCKPQQLKSYPKAKKLLSWGLFKHESQIVELDSLESLNNSSKLRISFKGEDSSQSQDYISDKRVEALTPDYMAVYKTSQAERTVYTEFERTRKSNEALLDKIQRYYNYFSPDNFEALVLRLIFQTQNMERSFWLNIFMNRPTLLKLNIASTNLDLLSSAKQFLGPVYAAESTVKLSKEGQLKADISQRVKLFDFL